MFGGATLATAILGVGTVLGVPSSQWMVILAAAVGAVASVVWLRSGCESDRANSTDRS